MQRLADVDVARPGGVEVPPERPRPKCVQQRLLVEIGARHELHHPEAPRIVEGNERPRRHVKLHMVMREMSWPRVIIPARRMRAALLRNVKRAGHAEVHDQHFARREIGEQIFCAPVEPLNALALQALHEIRRQRPAQIAALRLDLGEARALHDRLQSAANGLDFGQLGHVAALLGSTDIASLACPRYGPATSRTFPMQRGSATTHFGFHQLPIDDMEVLVYDVFGNVASRYDLMNDLMSGGLHRAWKDALVSAINPPAGKRRFALLDLRGGPGGLAARVIKAGGAGTRVTVLDINPEMIAVGRARVQEHAPGVTFIEGNAEALPLRDGSFDAVTIAFGIRNVPRIETALAEAHRVLRIGGHFLCLEFSTVDVPV